VREMLEEMPEILNVKYQWGDNDWESAIQAAAHVGSVPVAEYLLSRGAPLVICTAAMLGRKAEIESILAADASLIKQDGAHGIPLLAHAAFNGDAELFAYLISRGAESGISYALYNAVDSEHTALAKWILENAQPDLTWKNFEGKTILELAVGRGNPGIRNLLRAQGVIS
jgi:uncharacterized protein